MTTTDRAALGRSSMRRGLTWQRRCAQAARQWFPNADHCGIAGNGGRARSGDLSAIGDRIIECTVEPWSGISKKLAQAEGDASIAGLGEFWVWKSSPGQQPDQAYMVTRAAIALALMARADRLERMLDEALAELEKLHG